MPENPYEPPRGMESDVSDVAAGRDLVGCLVDLGVGLLIVVGVAVLAALAR